MFNFSNRTSRPVTSELLDMAEQGLLDWEQLARDALGYMSEADVAQFARANDLLEDSEEDEPDVDEATEWADFDPEC